ncbi:hypothetical protein Vretimale_11414 [Volvox reticuliferus]|uniref:Uncharacterized protein n=1 Tax=Volvox reticuliferus TaxID=1737510 RepID=A0A8J4FRK7_9CHLO|nr:hypothetical protein Vretifemale_11901 [Volvox reticuliferus]GIM07308.1 hypothetical protein Vretimale_11414 [Volvox reticuliferus]
MLPEMVQVADLQCGAEWFLVDELNEMMEGRGLGTVTYISEAVSRLHNKFTSFAEKQELREVLVDLFKNQLGSEQHATSAIAQWPVLMKWRRQRVAFAHPLGDKDVVDPMKLNTLKAQVQQAPAYAPVRDAALALIVAAEKMPVM